VPVAVSASVSGLSQNSTYHFRLIARGEAGGTINGSDAAFQTLEAATKGSLDLTVLQFDGRVWPGAVCRLYDGAWSYLGVSFDRVSDGSGHVGWVDLTPGTYYAEAYFSGGSTFPGKSIGEFTGAACCGW